MDNRIKYQTGVSGIAASLGGVSDAALSKGYEDTAPKQPDPYSAAFDPAAPREDENGSMSIGDRWAFRKTGACGRPRGDER